MKNCIITQLEGIVMNDNLDKYKVLRFELETRSNATTAGSILTIRGNTARVYDESKTLLYTFDNVSNISYSFGNSTKYIIEVDNKYNLYQITISGELNIKSVSLNIDNLKYSTWTEGVNTYLSLQYSGIYGNISSVKSYIEYKKEINITNSSIEGTLEDISQFDNFNQFTSLRFSPSITGHITSISGAVACTYLYINSGITYYNELKEFLDTMADNRQTSGTMAMILPAGYQGNNAGITKYNPTITFDGQGGWTWA